MVHGQSVDSTIIRGAGPSARSLRERHVRARRPHRVAYASTRSDVDRHSGLGWAQREGGPVEEIRPGDVVWFPPNEKHWHGAMPTTAMTHIAIQEALDGRTSSTGWSK